MPQDPQDPPGPPGPAAQPDLREVLGLLARLVAQLERQLQLTAVQVAELRELLGLLALLARRGLPDL